MSITAIELGLEHVQEAQLLARKADSLRAQAKSLPDPLATTYRRRASELELEAWVLRLQASDGAVAVPA